MSMIIQYIIKTEGFSKKTMPTIWGADWYNLQHSWSLYHTLDLTRYNEIMLKTWEGDCNNTMDSTENKH